MIYRPLNVPQDAKDLPRFLTQELQRLSQALAGGTDYVQFNPLSVEPAKRREGMEVMADGTNWNPGSGIGKYIYYSGAWHFLG